VPWPAARALLLLSSSMETVSTPEVAQVDAPAAEAEDWELSGTVLYSDPPGSEDRLTPILYANRGQLHLEARYNYEDLETGSVWVGWNCESGEELTTTVTPMFGVVAGETDGIAPGLELDMGWKGFSWYAEAEYLIGLDDRDDDFFYMWSTLTYGFTDWLDAGLVTERTKLVDTDYSVQRGLALQLHKGGVGLSLYAYNIGTDDSYAAVSFDLTR